MLCDFETDTGLKWRTDMIDVQQVRCDGGCDVTDWTRCDVADWAICDVIDPRDQINIHWKIQMILKWDIKKFTNI